MGFGIPNNTLPTPNSGFNPTSMFRGFNMGNGIRSQFLGWLNHEFKYTTVFSFLVRASTVITTFDWNASDKELKAKYKAISENMASAWGAVFGRGLGSATAIAMGGAVALKLPKIGSGALAREIMKEASLDAKAELLDEVVQALRITRNQGGQLLLLEGFMRFRSFIKSDTVPEALLATIYGKETASFMKRGWGEENGETYVIAQKIDEKVSTIKNTIVQEFVREALEEFGDSFIETGFVIAQGFDDALRQYQLANARTEEPPIIEVFPDARNSNERYIVEGDTQEEIEDNVQQITNTHRVMQNRDVGQIVAESVERYRSVPMMRKMEIIFRSIPRSPFYFPNGERAKETIISIPNVKRGLTWSKIKRTFGNGQIAYVHGDRWAKINFNESNRFLRVRIADSEVGGITQKLKDWAELSELTYRLPVAINDYHGGQNASQRTTSTPMYAVHLRLIKSNVLPSGRLSGNPPEILSYPLWVEDEPLGFKENFRWV